MSSVAGMDAPTATWITLGTAGGPPIHADQSQIANALLVGDAVYLFDVGNGVLRQLDAAGLGVRQIRGVFLSHHHLDHNADLNVVLMSCWLFGSAVRPLPVTGPPGTVALVAGLAQANAATVLASFPVDRPAQPPVSDTIAAVDLPRRMDSPTVVFEDDLIRVSAITVDHFQVPPHEPLPEMPVAVGFRVEAGGRVFAYSGDTGPSANFTTLAAGADVMISEVVDLAAIEASLRRMLPDAAPGQVEALVHNMGCNHLTPDEIGRAAAAAGVGHVVLTHFVPSFADQPDEAAWTRGIDTAYGELVTVARDLDRF